MDSPSDVLPTPGGPTSARMAPGLRRLRADVVDAALGPQLADGEVLDDALLHLVEAGVVGVEDGAGDADVELVVGALGPRQVEDDVEPALDPAALGALLGHALEACRAPCAAACTTSSLTPAASSASMRAR